jgi:hypothetical protein
MRSSSALKEIEEVRFKSFIQLAEIGYKASIIPEAERTKKPQVIYLCKLCKFRTINITQMSFIV